MIYSFLLVATFHLELEVIVLHLAVVVALIVLSVLWKQGFRIGKMTYSSAWLIGCMLLAILDTWSWVAQKAFMHDRSYAVLVKYLPDVPHLAGQVLPLPPAAILVLMFGALSLVGFLGWRTGGALWEVIDDLPLLNATTSRRLFLVMLVLLVVSFWTVKDMGRRYGEPLTDIVSSFGLESSSRYPIRASVEASANRVVQEASSTSYPNVVVIVVDALRADHTPQYGYERNTLPLLSREFLKLKPLQVSLGVSNCSTSVCGIWALTSGRSWDRADPSVPTLPDVLRSAGYQTRMIASGDFSRGYPKLGLFAGGLDSSYVDGWDSNGGSTDDRIMPEALSNMSIIEGSPLYLYLHLHSVHTAGKRFVPPEWLPEDGPVVSVFTNFLMRLKEHVLKQDAAAEAAESKLRRDVNHYDNSVLQADSILVSILTELDLKGILDDAIIVVTSDHGEALGDRGVYFHGSSLYQEQIQIPIWIIDTSGPIEMEVPFARQIDIAPTIASRLGVAAPPGWEGVSLIDGLLPGPSFHVTTREPYLYSVIDASDQGVHKLIVDGRGNRELFDLIQDPTELVNRIADSSYASQTAYLDGLLQERFFDEAGNQNGAMPMR